MVRTVLALAVVALAACHGAGPPGPPSNHAPPPAAPIATSDVLGYLPIDSDLVIGIDVRALRASALWHDVQPGLAAVLGAQLPELERACSFDPIETVDSIAVAGRGEDNRVLVVRGWGRDRSVACLHAAAGRTSAVTVDQDVITIAHKDGPTYLASFVDPSTLVVEASVHSSKQRLREVLGSGAPLRRSPAFLAMYQRLERDATLWILINGNGTLLDQLAASGVRPRGIYGTVRLAAGVSSTIHVRMPTVDQATQLASMLNAQVHSVQRMVDHVAVTADGEVATLALGMSADQLRVLVKSATSMFGGIATP